MTTGKMIKAMHLNNIDLQRTGLGKLAKAGPLYNARATAFTRLLPRDYFYHLAPLSGPLLVTK